MASHETVICNYVENDGGAKKGTNVFIDGDTLYSYGYYFPMAVRMSERIPKGCKEVIVVNGDRYSVTTSGHQSMLQGALYGSDRYVTTSFGALQRAVEHVRRQAVEPGEMVPFVSYRRVLDYVRLIDFDQERYQDASYKWKIENPEGLNIKDIPYNATIRTEKNAQDVSVIVSWHVAAGSVFQDVKTGIYFVCGMDENSYFVSVLPGRARNVKAAFDMLKPAKIRKAERVGMQVVRQGEWFSILFADGDEAKKIYKDMDQNFMLPGDGNAHIVTRGMVHKRRILWSGGMTHPEHRTLRVSKATAPEVWQAIANRALASFSEEGVD